MKRVLASNAKRRSKNKFSYSAHRKGRIHFDNIEVYEETYSYNNLSNKVCDMNFVFDTVAHINYAAYLDSEDWTSQDVEDAVADSINVTELIDTWNASAIDHIAEIPNDCVKCKVTLTMYGVGNKQVKIYTTIYGDQHGYGDAATFDYSDVTTLFGNNSYVSTEPNIYSTIRVTPTKLKLLVREVIKYITAGL